MGWAVSRRLKLTLIWLGGLLALLLLAAVVTVYVLLQPDRFTAMLQDQASAAGLELHLASPASPSLFPRPALDLRGITLNAQGATAPILLAARGRLALPWRTLLGGTTVISELQIDSPRVDLDALQGWLASLPAPPESPPLNIPRIGTGVSITGGSLVRGNQLLLDEVSMKAGSLMSGQPFPLSISATTASGRPLQLRLAATPRISGDALQLQHITLHLSQGAGTQLALSGHASWHGKRDAAATLTGTLDDANAGQYAISLALTAAESDQPLLLALKLDGPGNHADLRVPPLELARWWAGLNDQQGPQLAVPPGSGSARIAQIDVGSVSITGLSVQAGDAVPAAASSVPTPAAASSSP